jgi:hypothetical protein
MNLTFVPEEELNSWKEEAQIAAFGDYRIVLDDRPELSGSSEGSRSDDDLSGVCARDVDQWRKPGSLKK